MKRRLIVLIISLLGCLTAFAGSGATPALAHHHTPLLDGDLYDSLDTAVEMTWATLDGSGVPISVLAPAYSSLRTYNATTDSFTDLARSLVDGNGVKLYASVSDAGQGWSCVHSSTNSDFHPLWVIADFKEDARRAWDVKFHGYLQNRARTISDMGLTKQLEVCAVGGADAQNGWRQLENGMSMSVDSNNPRNLIARQYARMTTTSPTSASLSFNAGYKSVSIGGSLSQQYTGELGGKPGSSPYPGSATDAFPETAATAWWHSTDTWNRYSGSAHFQGTVSHALWEFPQNHGRVTVPLSWYYVSRCGSTSCPSV